MGPQMPCALAHCFDPTSELPAGVITEINYAFWLTMRASWGVCIF